MRGLRFSENDGTRTRNHRIDSPPISRAKHQKNKAHTASEHNGRSDDLIAGETLDPDLARVVAAWPTLSEPIRRAVLALIGSAAE